MAQPFIGGCPAHFQKEWSFKFEPWKWGEVWHFNSEEELEAWWIEHKACPGSWALISRPVGNPVVVRGDSKRSRANHEGQGLGELGASPMQPSQAVSNGESSPGT